MADTSFDEADCRPIEPPPMYLRKSATELLSTAQVPLADAAQRGAVEELRAAAEQMFVARQYGAVQRTWLDEACLRRHLRATKWSVPDATALLDKVLTYRDSRGIWNLRGPGDDERSAKIGDQVRSGKCYRNGFDKHGRPIIYMRDRRNRRQTDGTPPINKRYPDILLHLMNCLEQATRTMPLDRGVEQWTFVIDMSGFSLLGGDEMQHSRDSIDIFNAQYAERLGVAYIVHAPWYFSVFYKLMAPFIEPETKAKFKVVGVDELLQDIDKSVLESVFGGDNRCKFDFEHYYGVETRQIHEFMAHEAKLVAQESDDDDDDGKEVEENETEKDAGAGKKKKKKRSKKKQQLE
jgi:hypothetical protein